MPNMSLTQPRLSNFRNLRQLARPVALAVLLMSPIAAMGQSAPPAPQPAPSSTTDPFADSPTQPTDTHVAAAQDALRDARQKLADLQSRIDRNQSDLTAVNQKLSQADNALNKQREDLAKAEEALASKHQAAEGAKSALAAAEADYDATLKNAAARFESSEPFQRAKSEADSAQALATAREAAVMKQLSATAAFKRAQDAAAQTDQTARSLATSRPASDSDLADARQTADEARARLSELQARYLGEDSELKAYRAKAQETAAALEKLREDFGDRLPQQSEVASARSGIELHQTTFDTINASIASAQAARDAADAAVRQATDALKPDIETAARLQKEQDDLTGQLAQARADMDRAQTSLTTAVAMAERAQQQAVLAEQERQQAELAAEKARQDQQAAQAAEQARKEQIAQAAEQARQQQAAQAAEQARKEQIAQAAEQARQQQAAQAAEQARKEQIAQAAEQARQQAALAQQPSTATPANPFDNPPPAESPSQSVPYAQVPPDQSQPGPSSSGEFGTPQAVQPSQPPQGLYHSVPATSYPAAPPTGYAYPYGYSYPYNGPVAVNPPVAVESPVYVDPYGYTYGYSYAPYYAYGGSGYYGYYRPRSEIIIRGGFGGYAYSDNRSYSYRSYARYGGSPEYQRLSRDSSGYSYHSYRAEPSHVTGHVYAPRHESAHAYRGGNVGRSGSSHSHGR